MLDEPVTVDPPLYLAGATVGCWRCGAPMPVVALLAPNVPGAEGEPCLLSAIRELPPAVLSFIQSRFPTFRRTHSKTLGAEYLANTCRHCGVLYGDFCLFDEPGAPFFPTSVQGARAIWLQEIPLPGPVALQASLATGAADLLLRGARRVGQSPALRSPQQRPRRS